MRRLPEIRRSSPDCKIGLNLSKSLAVAISRTVNPTPIVSLRVQETDGFKQLVCFDRIPKAVQPALRSWHARPSSEESWLTDGFGGKH